MSAIGSARLEASGCDSVCKSPLCAIAFLMGIVPTLFTKPMEPAVRRIVERVQGAEPVRVNNEIRRSRFNMQTADASTPQGDVSLAADVSPR